MSTHCPPVTKQGSRRIVQYSRLLQISSRHVVSPTRVGVQCMNDVEWCWLTVTTAQRERQRETRPQSSSASCCEKLAMCPCCHSPSTPLGISSLCLAFALRCPLPCLLYFCQAQTGLSSLAGAVEVRLPFPTTEASLFAACAGLSMSVGGCIAKQASAHVHLGREYTGLYIQ